MIVWIYRCFASPRSIVIEESTVGFNELKGTNYQLLSSVAGFIQGIIEGRVIQKSLVINISCVCKHPNSPALLHVISLDWREGAVVQW